MVTRQGLVIVAIGLAVGPAGALGLNRLPRRCCSASADRSRHRGGRHVGDARRRAGVRNPGLARRGSTNAVLRNLIDDPAPPGSLPLLAS
jgi:hypothetical protein